ncbi:MAG TPA: hypothetical protein GXX14_09625 [Clostridiaceae bacterium]|nr:hypothetical protein [Clostridiaceae bacterium]
MRLKGERGQIAVFLSIILIPVVLITGVLIDIARLSAAETQVKKAVELAAQSVLADYERELKENYGIFALSTESDNQLIESIKSYLEKNLMIRYPGDNNPGQINIYNYRIENIKVTPFFNLTENEVVRNQILEYMKYRAPAEIIEGVWDRISAVKSAAKLSETYRKKINVDKMLGKMDKLQQKLKNVIDGSGGIGNVFVNSFNQNGVRDKLVDDYANLVISYKSLSESLNSINSDIRVLEEQIHNGNNNDETNKDLKDRLDELKDKRDGVLQEIRRLGGSISSAWEEIRKNQTEAFIDPNQQAEKYIDDIVNTGREATAAIAELELFLKEQHEEGDRLFGEFKESCQEDINKLKSLILQGEKAVELKEEVVNNRTALFDSLGGINEVKAAVDRQDWNIIPGKDAIISLLNRGLDGYNNRINYDYLMPDRGPQHEDPRREKDKEVKESLEVEDGNYKDIREAGIDIEELPSRKKVETGVFGSEDDEQAGNGGQTYHSETQEVNYEGELNNLDKEVDLTNEDEKFTDNAFGFISSMGRNLSKSLKAIRDEIYINEYIMGTFKNSVPKLKINNEEVYDLDLRSIEKKFRDTFFESEVEYILHGNPSEKANKIMTEAQILLIRFGLNTIHVYTDVKKKEFANLIATSIAGWWTGGAGIPIISNLIMCAWGMGEAVLDLKDIMDGKAVPFYKSKSDWKLDIGLNLNMDGNESKEVLSFSYYDYLRLFLLMVDPDKKISRIEDLIELNMNKSRNGFKMYNSNTYLRIEAEVSVNYIFITRPFMPVRMRTEDGRHLIKTVLYEGY